MTEAQDMEELISRGLRERVNYFKEQADSLTLEGVRRVLEKDLGLKNFALDVHKRFVKKCLEESFASLGDECAAKKTEENGEQAVTDEEKAEASVEQQNGEKKNNSVDDEKGSQASHKEVKAEPADKTDAEDVVSEDTVKKAVNDRAVYFRGHAATITMVGVRRLLEDDLKLEKHALDVHKALIKMAVNEVINSADTEDEEVDKGEGSSDAESPEQSSSEEAEMEDQKKTKSPKTAEKKRATNSEGQKKRKRVEEEDLNVRKKKPEVSEQKSYDSDEDGSQTSGEDRVKKKKEASSQVYGKHVEHLKSVIKACGMNVPPSVYKRAKQAPENKREDILAKELEEILKKEGLSSNPSEKEIKAVKKKKERAKELEGIDTSNIVSSSRRRSSSFFTKPPPPPSPPPPKAKIPDEGGEKAEGDEDEDDEEEESEEENSDNEESSEEFNEDADDESD